MCCSKFQLLCIGGSQKCQLLKTTVVYVSLPFLTLFLNYIQYLSPSFSSPTHPKGEMLCPIKGKRSVWQK